MIRIDKLMELAQAQFELWLFFSLPAALIVMVGIAAHRYRKPILRWLGSDWGLISVGLTLVGIGIGSILFM